MQADLQAKRWASFKQCCTAPEDQAYAVLFQDMQPDQPFVLQVCWIAGSATRPCGASQQA